jgi:hypothetical protein
MNLKSVVQRIIQRETILVHSWGGLGSQIFACVIARRLTSLYPNRKVTLVFHSSGVTKRSLELSDSFKKQFSFITIGDYVENEHSNARSLESFLSSLFRTSISFIVESFGFLARLNSENQFNDLRPWLLQVRGHYTGIQLKAGEIDWIINNLDISRLRCEALKSLTVHFRLGDLRSLKTKSHIPLSRLSTVINERLDMKHLKIFSDSQPAEVHAVLDNSINFKNYEVLNLETRKVIQESCESTYFIGTNSKISLWITIIRVFLGQGECSWLPMETFEQLLTLFPRQYHKSNLRSY